MTTKALIYAIYQSIYPLSIHSSIYTSTYMLSCLHTKKRELKPCFPCYLQKKKKVLEEIPSKNKIEWEISIQLFNRFFSELEAKVFFPSKHRCNSYLISIINYIYGRYLEVTAFDNSFYFSRPYFLSS